MACQGLGTACKARWRPSYPPKGSSWPFDEACGGVAGTVTLPEGIEMVMPGDNVTANFELISPVAMEPGLRFAMREGGRTVGAGVVSKVLQ